MQCGVCGTTNTPGTSFCSNCSTLLTPPSQHSPAPRSGGAGTVITAVVAILSTLALAAVLVFVFVNDDSTTPATTISTPTSTTTPIDTSTLANEAWQSYSAAFLQPHTDEPFASGGRILAIATVDDIAARTSTSISGLVLLAWEDDQWISADGIPWSAPDSEATIEVLGDQLVDHPMILITGCCPDTNPSTFVLRVFADELRDVVTDLPIDESWTELALLDRSFDFLEYTECSSGEDITLASGDSTFFCDLELRTRLDIMSDESVRITEETVEHERPQVIYPDDLRIDGHLMTRPPCDGSYIVAVGASISASEVRNRANVTRLLHKYPGASYLINDQTCDSLWPSVDGNPIYLVYFGPFATKGEACDARSDGPKDAYVRPLSNDMSHHTRVYC